MTSVASTSSNVSTTSQKSTTKRGLFSSIKHKLSPNRSKGRALLNTSQDSNVSMIKDTPGFITQLKLVSESFGKNDDAILGRLPTTSIAEKALKEKFKRRIGSKSDVDAKGGNKFNFDAYPSENVVVNPMQPDVMKGRHTEKRNKNDDKEGRIKGNISKSTSQHSNPSSGTESKVKDIELVNSPSNSPNTPKHRPIATSPYPGNSDRVQYSPASHSFSDRNVRINAKNENGRASPFDITRKPPPSPTLPTHRQPSRPAPPPPLPLIACQSISLGQSPVTLFPRLSSPPLPPYPSSNPASPSFVTLPRFTPPPPIIIPQRQNIPNRTLLPQCDSLQSSSLHSRNESKSSASKSICAESYLPLKLIPSASHHDLPLKVQSPQINANSSSPPPLPQQPTPIPPTPPAPPRKCIEIGNQIQLKSPFIVCNDDEVPSVEVQSQTVSVNLSTIVQQADQLNKPLLPPSPALSSPPTKLPPSSKSVPAPPVPSAPPPLSSSLPPPPPRPPLLPLLPPPPLSTPPPEIVRGDQSSRSSIGLSTGGQLLPTIVSIPSIRSASTSFVTKDKVLTSSGVKINYSLIGEEEEREQERTVHETNFGQDGNVSMTDLGSDTSNGRDDHDDVDSNSRLIYNAGGEGVVDPSMFYQTVFINQSDSIGESEVEQDSRSLQDDGCKSDEKSPQGRQNENLQTDVLAADRRQNLSHLLENHLKKMHNLNVREFENQNREHLHTPSEFFSLRNSENANSQLLAGDSSKHTASAKHEPDKTSEFQTLHSLSDSSVSNSELTLNAEFNTSFPPPPPPPPPPLPPPPNHQHTKKPQLFHCPPDHTLSSPNYLSQPSLSIPLPHPPQPPPPPPPPPPPLRPRTNHQQNSHSPASQPRPMLFPPFLSNQDHQPLSLDTKCSSEIEVQDFLLDTIGNIPPISQTQANSREEGNLHPIESDGCDLSLYSEQTKVEKNNAGFVSGDVSGQNEDGDDDLMGERHYIKFEKSWNFGSLVDIFVPDSFQKLACQTKSLMDKCMPSMNSFSNRGIGSSDELPVLTREEIAEILDEHQGSSVDEFETLNAPSETRQRKGLMDSIFQPDISLNQAGQLSQPGWSCNAPVTRMDWETHRQWMMDSDRLTLPHRSEGAPPSFATLNSSHINEYEFSTVESNFHPELASNGNDDDNDAGKSSGNSCNDGDSRNIMFQNVMLDIVSKGSSSLKKKSREEKTVPLWKVNKQQELPQSWNRQQTFSKEGFNYSQSESFSDNSDLQLHEAMLSRLQMSVPLLMNSKGKESKAFSSNGKSLGSRESLDQFLSWESTDESCEFMDAEDCRNCLDQVKSQNSHEAGRNCSTDTKLPTTTKDTPATTLQRSLALRRSLLVDQNEDDNSGDDDQEDVDNDNID